MSSFGKVTRLVTGASIETYLLEKARTEIGLETDRPAPSSSAESTRVRRPTVAEMHRMAEGRTVDQAVQRWLDEVDDGSVRAEIEQLRADNDLLGELAAVHREDVPAGSSMLEAPTPPGYEIIREIDRGAQGAVFALALGHAAGYPLFQIYPPVVQVQERFETARTLPYNMCMMMYESVVSRCNELSVFR